MKRDGFTLVELLAVIVILAIILAIAIPSISGIIDSATSGAFESDAKMVLKQLEYEKLQDDSFNVTDVDKDTIVDLNLSNNNYGSLKVGVVNNKPYIIIVGKAKWAGLKACGTTESINVVDEDDTTTCETIPITIVSMHPNVVNSTCNSADLANFCVSEINLFPYFFTPVGYSKCDGQTLTIAANNDLYSLIGTTFGGDSRVTFGLPNLTAPLAGINYYIANTGLSPNLSNVSPLVSGSYNYFSHQSEFKDYLVGEIVLASNVDENDDTLLPCDGRVLTISNYGDLYSLIGTAFGGDSRVTFGLPDLSSVASPVDGAGYYIFTSGVLPQR